MRPRGANLDRQRRLQEALKLTSTVSEVKLRVTVSFTYPWRLVSGACLFCRLEEIVERVFRVMKCRECSQRRKEDSR